MPKFKTHNSSMFAITIERTFKNLLSQSSLVSPLDPYMFFKADNTTKTDYGSQTFLRLNRQISPLELSKNQSYSIWSQFHLSNYISKIRASNSLISNPFKTDKLIEGAFINGISKMVVDDIDEMSKVQMKYYESKKKNQKVTLPEMIWGVDDSQEDLRSLERLNICKLDIAGLYFRRQYELGQIKMFLQEAQKFGHPIKTIIKQISETDFSSKRGELKELGIQAEIYDYSEIDDYVMAARVIGKDKLGQNIYADQCYQFLCSKSLCTCFSDKSIIHHQISFNNQLWALLKPQRIDILSKDDLIRCSSGKSINAFDF